MKPVLRGAGGLRTARKEHLAGLPAMPDLWQNRELVSSDATGGVLDGDRVRRAHYRYLQELGLPRIKPHELRHSHATHLVSQGADINQVAAPRTCHAGLHTERLRAPVAWSGQGRR